MSRLKKVVHIPKNLNLHIRLTEEEKSKIVSCSEILGISKTDVIRMGVDKVYKKAMRMKKH